MPEDRTLKSINERRHQGNHFPGDRFDNISAHYELLRIDRASLFPDAPMRNNL
jgi:hypothetical protein